MMILYAWSAIGALACGSETIVAPQQDTTQVLQQAETAVPASIDATGSADVSDALNEFFMALPDGSTVTFAPEGTYRVEGTLYFENRHGITIEGNGATILVTTDGSATTPPEGTAWEHNWPRNRSQFSFHGGSGIEVRNLTIQGPHPNAGVGDAAYVGVFEAQHAFNVLGVQGFELDNVRATDVYGDFVYLGPRQGEWTRDVHVHDSHFERNGRQGISFTGAENVLIERIYLGQIRRSTFDIEPNSTAGGVRNITIRDNEFGPGRLAFVANGGHDGILDGLTIQDNRLVGKAMNMGVQPPEGSRRSNIKIIGNTSDQEHGNPGGGLMNFYRVDGLEVVGNTLPVQPGRDMIGVKAYESCDVTVQDNVFDNAIQESEVGPYSC